MLCLGKPLAFAQFRSLVQTESTKSRRKRLYDDAYGAALLVTEGSPLTEIDSLA
jgi:hypothetical protein